VKLEEASIEDPVLLEELGLDPLDLVLVAVLELGRDLRQIGLDTPLIAVARELENDADARSGVRSSCEKLASSRFSLRTSASMRVAISSKPAARSPISS
jgi:hypothetical protein